MIIAVSSGCGTMFDISGRGAKIDCLFLDTGTFDIMYECGEKKIESLIIYENKDAKELFGKVIYREKFNAPGKRFGLPFHPDSMMNKFIRVEMHLTDSHHRESYYIDIKPGDLGSGKKICSRYFSH